MTYNNRSAFYAFLIPGLPQLGGGEKLKGFLYFLLALATAIIAFSVNRYFFLKYLWEYKALEMPSTFIREYYASKQATLYNFIFIYFIIGLVSAVDKVRCKN